MKRGKKRNPWIAVFLLVCLCFCSLPFSAFAASDGDLLNSGGTAQEEPIAEAAGEGAEDPQADPDADPKTDPIVCKIGALGFTSLKDAAAYASAGQETTIVMVADVLQTETVEIPADKNLIITDDGTARTIKADTKSLFDVRGTLTIEGTADDKLILDGGNCTTRNIAGVVGGTMNIKCGTINGGTVTTTEGILYVEEGTLNLSGGIIQKTKCIYGGYDGPIKISDNGIINMTGGIIRDNDCLGSGGIVAVSMDLTKTPMINISGGKISGNKGRFGVAVMAAYNAIVNISGGEFSNNVDIECGTGSQLASGTIYVSNSQLNMTGGVIKDNQMCRGGGFYISRNSEVTISGGQIVNNTADVYGGALFMDDSKPNVYLVNALITENSASVAGGGIWCCPTGTAQIQATEGVAVFDNSADGAGDDFTNLCTERQNYPVEIAPRMLGAGKIELYKDGAVTVLPKGDANYWYGGIDASVPRYNENSERQDPEAIGTECLALKVIASDEAKNAAREHALTIISGNSAGYGGGIASNGTLFGFQPNPDREQNSDLYRIRVKKQWQDVPDEKKVPVVIALIAHGEELDTIELNEDNGWEASFTDLPDPATLNGGYTVVEKTTGFTVTYSTLINEDDPLIMEVTVTNSLEETPPGENPPTPEKPKTPDKSQQVKKNTVSPRTADESAPVRYTAILFLAVAAALCFRRRRSSYK